MTTLEALARRRGVYLTLAMAQHHAITIAFGACGLIHAKNVNSATSHARTP